MVSSPLGVSTPASARELSSGVHFQERLIPAAYRSAIRSGKIGIRRGIGGVSTGGGLGVARAVGINRSSPPRNAPLEVSWRRARSTGHWNTPSRR